MTGFPRTSAPLAGGCLALAAVLALAGEFSQRAGPGALGALLVVAFVALEWRRLPAAGKVFVAAALGLLAITGLAADPWALIVAGLGRASFMCAFLVALGSLAAAAEGSEIVGRCGRYLLGQPPGRRFAAFWTGGHLFGAIISLGVLNLFGVMVMEASVPASGGGRTEALERRTRRALMALLRGFTTSIAWSPLSVSFAIVVTSLPGVFWPGVIAAGLGMALLFGLLGWLADRWQGADDNEPPLATEGWSVMLFPVGLIGLIFAIAWGLENLAGVSLISGVMTAAPLVALGWLLVQGRQRPAADAADHVKLRWRHYLSQNLPAYRMEMTILSTAGFVGVVVGHFLAPETVAVALSWFGAPAALVPALVMALVIGGGLVGLNALITVMILGGALPHPEAFGVQPVILASAFLAAWSLTVGSSPVAMSTLVTGGFTGHSGARVGLIWNGPYTLAGYVLAAILLGGAVVVAPIS